MDHAIITHHGGADGVTGSCHRLQIATDRALLVDCGLFQGEDTIEDDHLEQHHVDFPVADLLALIVTHVHIDHIGRLPYLLAAGYQGPILCSVPSARLLPLVIEDALKIGFTRDERMIQRFLAEVEQRLVPLDYRDWHTLVDDDRHRVRIRLQRAGHILGSAYVEVDVQDVASGAGERIVFSGDLGAPHAPLLTAPNPPHRADRLVLESTYGDRNHEGRHDRRKRLKAAIDRALENRGTVIIPAFSIGRTQELLYELEGLVHSGTPGTDSTDWPNLEIIVDSPLAARFTRVYRDLKPYWDAEAHKRLRAGRHPLDFDNLYTVDDHDEHLQTVDYLARTGRPAVVIAASGMAAGGRVVNYLKRMLGDERHCVLFVGYQAAGTPGRAIQQYGPGGGWVELDGERHTIRARVDTIRGYSAHADQAGLLRFVRRMRRPPHTIHLVHGEAHAQRALKARIEAWAAEAGRQLTVRIAESRTPPAEARSDRG
ncbi:MBL fold metallo-hydrolase [Aquisalimonas sp. 2447]|uniref:MBL fold metallo-hydrolase RNA specificity domain-containing protein n=1 Tax=Aquisalimonas sp. 2447 TaxID=2740807 RepID=UPI0014326E0E|nr:MBL fold metallo-hydrolase [Aquisalimonas sp. 2447]QIT55944.1 MBL fold metallo-hydrolase [Aquisalimonas sp. 2447]